MGEPMRGYARIQADEHIVCHETTRGTETSKYPEEKKSTEIALVAASESAPSLNQHVCKLWGVALLVLWGSLSYDPNRMVQLPNVRREEQSGKAGHRT